MKLTRRQLLQALGVSVAFPAKEALSTYKPVAYPPRVIEPTVEVHGNEDWIIHATAHSSRAGIIIVSDEERDLFCVHTMTGRESILGIGDLPVSYKGELKVRGENPLAVVTAKLRVMSAPENESLTLLDVALAPPKYVYLCSSPKGLYYAT